MEKCPSYRGVRLTNVRLIEVFYEKHTYGLPAHVKVSVLERCPSYGMSVLRGFTVLQTKLTIQKLSETNSNHPTIFYFRWSIIERETAFTIIAIT